tara:strand:- start:23761 stop:24213 length:453 start_codon:yes stop_codon:yes gene_type:complete
MPPSEESTRRWLTQYINRFFLRRRMHDPENPHHGRIIEIQAFLEVDGTTIMDTTENEVHDTRFRIVFKEFDPRRRAIGYTKWCYPNEWQALMNWCEFQERERKNIEINGYIDIHNVTLPPYINPEGTGNPYIVYFHDDWITGSTEDRWVH